MKKIILIACMIAASLSGFAYESGVCAISDITPSAEIHPDTPGVFIADDDDATSVMFLQDAGDASIELSLASRSLVYGAKISCDLAPLTTLTVEYIRGGITYPFTAGRITGARGTDILIDLSLDGIVTDEILLRLAGPDLSESSVSEIAVLGKSEDKILRKIAPVSIEATDNTCYFTPEENVADGNVYTAWRTRSLPTYDGPLALVKAFLSALKTRTWPPAQSPYEAYVTLDLGTVAKIKDINLYFAQYSSGNVSVRIMRGETWETVAYFAEGQTEGWKTVSLIPERDSTAQVRVYVEGSSWIMGGISEIEVWGYWSGQDEEILPIGIRGPVDVIDPLDFIFTIPEPKDYELTIEAKVSSPEALGLKLNGENLSIPFIATSDSTIYRGLVPGEKLWQGENFLSVSRGSGEVTFISAAIRGKKSDSPVIPGTFGDGFLLTPAQCANPCEITMGESVYLSHVEVFSPDNVSIEAFANGAWIPLAETERTDYCTTFDCNHITTDRLRISSGGTSAISEIRVSGSPTKDKAPEVKILYPGNWSNIGLIELAAGLVIGFVDNPDATVTVNGVAAEKFGHYFWVRMNTLGLQAGDVYTITATATDTEGRTGSNEINVTVGFANLITIDQPDSIIYTDQAAVTISGRKLLPTHKVEINGELADTTGLNFSKSIQLTPGLNLAKIRLIHKITGKALAIALRKIFRYSGGPSLTIDTPKDGMHTNRSAIPVSGSISGLPPMSVTVGAQPAEVKGSRYVCESVPLTEGENTITVTAVDQKGAQAQKTLTVYRDSQAPVLSDIAPSPGFVSSTSNVIVTGSVTDSSPVWVTVNGKSAKVTGNAFAVTLSLTDGEKIIEITAKDASGNSSAPVSFTITVDTVPPEDFTVTADPAVWTNNPSPVITYAATDAGSGIDRYELRIDDGDFSVSTSPHTLTPQPDGEHTITVRAYDRGGLHTEASTVVYIDTTAPGAAIELRAIPDRDILTVKWVKPNEDVIAYRLNRVPEWDDGYRMTETEEYIDSLPPVGAYVYQIIAIDRAQNESAIATSEIAVTGLAIETYTPETGSYVEFGDSQLFVNPGTLPVNVKKIIATEIQSENMTERAIYPIISPIYDYTVMMEIDGENRVVPHAVFEEKVLGCIKYDQSLIWEGFPEENLGVFYFDSTWSRWIKIPDTVVDKEQNLIFFHTNHFSEFSVQPTVIEDMSPGELADTGYSPFKTKIAHESISVSPQGGSVHTEATELYLPGKNGMDLVLKREYDSSLARMDAFSLGVSASLGLNLFDPAGMVKEITELLEQIGYSTLDSLISSFTKYFQNNGDYAYSMGQGWRLNLPYFRGSNGGLVVRTPSGGFYSIYEMKEIANECFSTGVTRTLVMENHTQEDFSLHAFQVRGNFDIVGLFENDEAALDSIKMAGLTLKALDLASEIDIDDIIAASGNFIDMLASGAVPDWITLYARLTLKDGTEYRMDGNGRTTKIIDPLGVNIIDIEYEGFEIDTITDSMGRVIKFHYQDFTGQSLTPRIVKIELLNDEYDRSVEYTIDSGTQTLTKAVQKGKGRNPEGMLVDSSREYSYEYENNYMLSYGGSIKANFISILGDIIAAICDAPGLFSAVTGWDNLTLSGNIRFESVESLSKAEGPGIGITSIDNRVVPLTYVDAQLADYFIFIPTSLEISFDVANILCAKSVTQAYESHSLTTNYSYEYEYAGKKQYANKRTVITDGRTRRTFNYDHKTFVIDCLLDWSDEVLYNLENRFLHNKEYIVRTYNTSITTLDSTGSYIQTETFDWNGSKTKIISQKLSRSEEHYAESSYTFDNWGNVAYTKEVIKAAERENRTETWTKYHNASNAVSLPDTSHPNPYNDPQFTIIRRDLPKGRITLNTVPESDPVYLETYYNYNENGQKIGEAVWTGTEWAETTFEYTDPFGRITKATLPEPKNHITEYVYDDDTSDGNYKITSRDTDLENVMDDSENTVTTAESTIKFNYDTGFKVEDKNPRGLKTLYQYDYLGRVTKIEKPHESGDNPITKILYNDTDLWSEVTTPNGAIVKYDYDNAGRLVEIIKDLRVYENEILARTDKVKTKIAYDPWGNITAIENPNNKITQYEYDPMGKTKKITYPADTGPNPEKTMEFDYEYNFLTIRDERGNRTTEQYDIKDRLLRRTQYNGITPITAEQYYDGLGNTIKTKDGNGNITQNKYDTRNLLAETILPQDTYYEQGTEETRIPTIRYEYDSSGHKIKDIIKINNNDYPITYTVDGLGRTIGTTQTYTTYTEGAIPATDTITTSIYFDLNGNKTKIVDGNGHETKYKYTNRDKLKEETSARNGITTYNYDSEDNKTSMTDPRGNTTNYTGDFTIAYEYDDLKRLVKAILPKNNDITENPIVTFTYDPRGNLLTRTEPDGQTTTYTYNTRNKVIAETITGTRANGTTVSYTTQHEYDKTLNETAAIDPDGNRTEKTYDDLNRLIRINHPIYPDQLEFFEAFDYDNNGNQTTFRDGKGNITETLYNAQNKPKQITDARGYIQHNKYDTRGNLVRYIDANGNAYQYTYNELNQLIEETDPLTYKHYYGYDKTGNKTYSKDPNGTELAYIYTEDNLIQSIIHNSAPITTYEYDEAGDLKTITHNGITTKNNYANDTYVPDPYSLVHTKTTTTSTRTFTTTYDYDTMNRNTRINDIAYNYNNLGQLEQVPGYTKPDPTYNTRGMLEHLEAENDTYAEMYYDLNSRLSDLNYETETDIIKATNYKYDHANNITQKNYNLYSYDENNQLTYARTVGRYEIDVKNRTQSVGARDEDYAGLRYIDFAIADTELKLDHKAMSIGVDLGDEFEINKVELYTTALNTRVKQRTLEVYAANMNADGAYNKITDWTLNVREDNTIEILFREPITAQYLKLHCLFDDRDVEENAIDVAQIRNSKQSIMKVYYYERWKTEQYTYDPKGNRLTKAIDVEGLNTKEHTYYPHSDRLKTDGIHGFNYDPNGNLTEKGVTYQDNADNLIFDNEQGKYWRYEYDIFNRMVGVYKSDSGAAQAQLVAEYTYDGENLRIRKDSVKEGTTWYVFGLSGEILREETPNETSEYVYVSGKLFAVNITKTGEGTERFYFVTDHLGTTEMLTDESGKVVWQEELSPFGEQNGEVGTVHWLARYTGKGLDAETGLLYFNARWYCPEMGRFITSDPKRSGSNFYIYALNNPLFFVDPDGKEPTPNPELRPPYSGNIEQIRSTEMYARLAEMEAKLAQAADLKAKMNDPNTRELVIKMLTRKFGTLDTTADPGSGFSNEGPSFRRAWNTGYSTFSFDFLFEKGMTQTEYQAGLDKNWLGRFLFFSNENVFYTPHLFKDSPGYYSGFDPIQDLPGTESILGARLGGNSTVRSGEKGMGHSTYDINIGFITGKATSADAWDTIVNDVLLPATLGAIKGSRGAWATASVYVNTARKNDTNYWSIMAPIPSPSLEPVSGNITIFTTPQYLNYDQLLYYYPDFSVDLALGLISGKKVTGERIH